MTGPRRKRLFGPLFYSTLVCAALVLIYVGAIQVAGWLDQRWRAMAERDEIEALTKGLRSSDVNLSERSARALLSKGPEVYRPILIEATHDPNDVVRATACQILGEGHVDSTEALGVLIEAASDRYEPVRLYAAEGMVRLVRMSTVPGRRDEARRALRRLLKDSSSNVRAVAAGSMEVFGPDPEIAADLTRAFDEIDRSVRLAAARSLIRINGPDDPAAARVLIAMAAAPEAVADRSDVLRAINMMSPPIRGRAAEAMAGLIRNADPDVLPDLLAAIAEAGTWARAAEPAMESLLDHPETDIRAQAAFAILAVECPENAQNLTAGGPAGASVGSMGSVPATSPTAGTHLSPKAASILARVMGDVSIPIELRRNAVALIRSAEASAITQATSALVRQLADPDPAVRGFALHLLEQIIDEAPVAIPSAEASR